VLCWFPKLVCDVLESVREPKDALDVIDEEFGVDIVQQKYSNSIRKFLAGSLYESVVYRPVPQGTRVKGNVVSSKKSVGRHGAF
jgi:hypothetical protein